MNVEQLVMAYQVEHDRIRAILPEGYESLRPVFRINVEIRKGKKEIVYFVIVNLSGSLQKKMPMEKALENQ